MIEVQRTTVERVSFDRDAVIGLLMEDEEYFTAEESARGLGPTPDEGRALWGERTDAELAEFLAERLGDGQYAADSVAEAFGERGTDSETWTAQVADGPE